MSFIENVKMAYDSIISNKMRSFLTMLGIIIGISAVITIISLGNGGQNSINDQIGKIGASEFTITVDPTQAHKEDYFTYQDINQIKNRVDSVKYISPTATKRGTVSTDVSSKTAILFGGNADLFYINNYVVDFGRFFNDSDVLQNKDVAVIDENSAKNLFGYEDVVGKSIIIGSASQSKTLKIIGVTASTGIFGFGNANAPIFINVPITVIQSLYSSDFTMDTISIMADSKENVESAGNSSLHVLESMHNNKGLGAYTATSLLSSLSQINNVLSIFTTFISAVAGISLIVGGVGVMNIMLVSVTERTREIGLRKSIGATTNNILLQFLTEAVIISLFGGIIGVTIGIVGSEIIGYFINILPSISVLSIVIAVLFSSAVGVFFGIYPARKAAKLDPIDALRYE